MQAQTTHNTDEPILESLVLTTQNRESGRATMAMLDCSRQGNDFVVAATNNRRGMKPEWFLNLISEPAVQVEVEGVKFHAKAKTSTGKNRLQLYPIGNSLAPGTLYNIPRDTSLVVLTPKFFGA